nr:NADH dehydrogenase subunit 6 [Polistes riparius]
MTKSNYLIIFIWILMIMLIIYMLLKESIQIILLMILLILFTLFSCLILNSWNSYSLYAFLIFLMMIGGLMILFLMFLSLITNDPSWKPKFNQSIIIMVILSISLFFKKFSMNIPKNYKLSFILSNLDKNYFLNMFKLLEFPDFLFTILLIIFLLLMLFLITKICLMNNKPLRKFN